MTSLAQAFGSANPVGGSVDLPGYMDTSDCWSNDLEEDPNIPFPAWVLQRRMRNNIVDRDTISQMSMDSTDSRWVYLHTSIQSRGTKPLRILRIVSSMISGSPSSSPPATSGGG